MKENEDTTYQNLWDAATIVFRGNLMATNAYVLNKRSQISSLTFHLKKLEKKGKLNLYQTKERKQIWTKINEVENRRTIKGTKPKVFEKDEQNWQTFN